MRSWWVRPVRGVSRRCATRRPASVPAETPTPSSSTRDSAFAPAWGRFERRVRTGAPARRPEAAAGISSTTERRTPLSLRIRLRTVSGNRPRMGSVGAPGPRAPSSGASGRSATAS